MSEITHRAKEPAASGPARTRNYLDERREFQRVPGNSELSAEVQRTGAAPFTAAILDVSRGGICFVSIYALDHGEVFMLHIDLGAGTLRMKCSVVRCTRNEDEDRYTIGAMFVEIHRSKFTTVDYERTERSRASRSTSIFSVPGIPVDQQHVTEVEDRLGKLPSQ